MLRDIESTQRYLISQRIVARSDIIAVHILTNQRHVENLNKLCQAENGYDFNIHEINSLLEHEEIDVEGEQDFSSALFCYLASKTPFVNHYAKAKEQRYYKHHQ